VIVLNPAIGIQVILLKTLLNPLYTNLDLNNTKPKILSYINIDHLKISVIDNKKCGIPLLFLHGFLGSSIDWIHQYYFYNNKYHILLIDLPGFGNSDKPIKEYSIEFFCSLILSLLRVLKYDEIILIGHSLGGMIAQQIAIFKPHLVKKLILINTTYSFSKSLFDKIKLLVVNLFFKFFYKKFLGSIIHKINSTNADNKKIRIQYKKALRLPKQVILKTFKNMTLKSNFEKYLPQISAPTLIIYGTNDKIISNSMIEKMNYLIPSSKIINVKNASHRIMFENYNRVNKIIDDFISN